MAGTPPEEHHHFGSQARGQISINGSEPRSFMATGPIDTVAYGRCPTCDTGEWQTEMLQMTLNGNSPFGPYGPPGSTRVVLGIPDPSSIVLFGFGLVGLAGLLRGYT